MKVLLVASGGGHLQHLRWLAPWWRAHERAWVTFPGPDAADALVGEAVHRAFHPTNRHLLNAVRNLGLALRVMGRERPDLLVTTGAGVAVPFAWAAWLAGVPVIYVEVLDRGGEGSLSGRLVAPVAHAVVLQREDQRAAYPDGLLLGPLR